MKLHLVSLVVLGPDQALPLPFPVAQTWLLDPHDPLEVLMPRLARWIEESPGAWILTQGGAAAVLLAVAGARLDLRIAGAGLISPKAWTGRRDRLSLPVQPVPFPVLIAERQAGRLPAPVPLIRAWSALGAPSPFTWPEGFLNLLKAQGRRPQPSTAAKVASDLASSTEEIASRTSSIVARTAQEASSGQSVQGK